MAGVKGKSGRKGDGVSRTTVLAPGAMSKVDKIAESKDWSVSKTISRLTEAGLKATQDGKKL